MHGGVGVLMDGVISYTVILGFLGWQSGPSNPKRIYHSAKIGKFILVN